MEKILVVGVGGIGCELLKFLVEEKNDITIVDDDYIEETNLGRQYIYRKKDIGRKKAEVAAERINDISVGFFGRRIAKGIFGDICKIKDTEIYCEKDVVYCCVDNSNTRSYVNQRCYMLGVLFVDGGSSGWLGQSFVNGEECFDCLPRKREQIYPVCSIRHSPKSFEHCIFWAKMANDSAVDTEKTAGNTCNSDEYIEIYRRAVEHAEKFNIEPMDFYMSKSIIDGIIPSICTTNSMVSSIMVLSRKKHRNYYITQGDRKIVQVELNKKRQDCITCSIPLYKCVYSKEKQICDFLDFFKGEKLVYEDGILTQKNTTPLEILNGSFGIVFRRKMKYRIYFEMDLRTADIVCKRIK